MKEIDVELILKEIDLETASADSSSFKTNEKIPESNISDAWSSENKIPNIFLSYSSTISSLSEWNTSEALTKERSKNTSILDLGEGTIIKNWKLSVTYSARVIEFNEDRVVLECLVDREERKYEEKEFEASIFKGFDLKMGKVFKLCFYQRPKQIMMEVLDNPNLVLEDDFRKIDFLGKFDDIKIVKRQKK